ncbi:MAG: Holliday junction branch migration protein RuvA [Kiritimatiellae bacterium]|nr:Holliday junction branch migration protein RuvA [Kiritimatiellia bacterium]MDD5519997.1 Holliday junction branch migration protein RuvA [Kiritimatiellia bacterium]
MITFLEGKLVEKQPTRIVIDVNGVGYEVFIPLSSYDRLPAVNEVVKVLTYDHVREDAHLLFGFVTDAERKMFIMLMSVSGIGPKLAMSVLSGMSVKEIKLAVISGDVKRLSSISGIGRKTAERMIVELRHKIGEADALEVVAGAEELPEDDMKIRDAIMALIALGYKQTDARKMVMNMLRGKDTSSMTVEEIVKKALGTAG